MQGGIHILLNQYATAARHIARSEIPKFNSYFIFHSLKSILKFSIISFSSEPGDRYRGRHRHIQRFPVVTAIRRNRDWIIYKFPDILRYAVPLVPHDNETAQLQMGVEKILPSSRVP